MEPLTIKTFTVDAANETILVLTVVGKLLQHGPIQLSWEEKGRGVTGHTSSLYRLIGEKLIVRDETGFHRQFSGWKTKRVDGFLHLYPFE